MSSAEAARLARGRGGERLLTIAILAALLAALLPVVRVIEPGWWLIGALLLAAMVLAAGYSARRYRLPAVAVTLIEAAVWVVFMTLVFLRDTALLWIIPTTDTIRVVPQLVEAAMVEITVGAAPLEPTLSLGFVVVGAMGLLTIIVDHVAVTARMPLLASVGIVAVSLIPAIAAPSDVDVIGFVFLAVTILFLIRSETRSREKPLEREAERTAGVPATALGIGAIAIVVAVVATPVLPQPGARAGTGVGPGPGIDATLQLGDDLRRPQEAEVLRLRTDAPSVPYLRATTLSRFEGGVWEPDRAQTISLGSERAFGGVDADAESPPRGVHGQDRRRQPRLAVGARALPGRGCRRSQCGPVGCRPLQPHGGLHEQFDPGAGLRGRLCARRGPRSSKCATPPRSGRRCAMRRRSCPPTSLRSSASSRCR